MNTQSPGLSAIINPRGLIALEGNRYPAFKTAAGRLTPYALACGYTEAFEQSGRRVTLWREHGTLHVRAHDFNTGHRLFWDCHETLTAARHRFDAAKRAIAKGEAIV